MSKGGPYREKLVIRELPDPPRPSGCGHAYHYKIMKDHNHRTVVVCSLCNREYKIRKEVKDEPNDVKSDSRYRQLQE